MKSSNSPSFLGVRMCAIKLGGIRTFAMIPFRHQIWLIKRRLVHFSGIGGGGGGGVDDV